MKSVLFLLTVVLWWYPSFTTLQVGWHLVVVAYNREELRGGHDLRDHQESTQQCLTGISWIAVSCPRSLSLKKNFSLVSWLLSWKHFHYPWLWFLISNLLSPKDKAPPPPSFIQSVFSFAFLSLFLIFCTLGGPTDSLTGFLHLVYLKHLFLLLLAECPTNRFLALLTSNLILRKVAIGRKG